MVERGEVLCYHRSEWSYRSEWSNNQILNDFGKEISDFYDKMIKNEKDSKRKDKLKQDKTNKTKLLKERVKNLAFWDEIKIDTSGDEKLKEFPKEAYVFHFNPMMFVEQMKRAAPCYRRNDKGKVVLELNIRLAGFGGMLPTEEFTELTEKGVKQFQRDYMKMTKPTGEADYATLEKIDEFCNKYRENVENYKCPCGSCGGFGKGQYKGQYSSSSKVEMYHKYEYPGIHQSLLWAVSAVKYYATFLKDNHKATGISSGYRCWIDNKTHNRTSSNHMGKAADITFSKGGILISDKKSTNLPLLKYIRDNLFVEYLDTTQWKKQGFSTEPIGLNDGETWSWIHLDVRAFSDKCRDDLFFIKSNNDKNFNKKIIDINN
jgi:hypothetical protein